MIDYPGPISVLWLVFFIIAAPWLLGIIFILISLIAWFLVKPIDEVSG